MGDKLMVYTSSVSSSKELKAKQQRIFQILDGKKISYENVDISTSEDLKNKMREICGDERALPPRFAKNDKYLGDYDKFDEAVECETLQEFLQL